MDEIVAIFGADEIQPFLNTRHVTYKAQGWAEKLPPQQELIAAIIAEPNLLRRPITRHDQQVVIGFEQEKLRQLINAA